MMGCSQDHAVELDIYSKPYSEKIKRIKMMKEQGNVAIAEFNKLPVPQQSEQQGKEFLSKASYYYA